MRETLVIGILVVCVVLSGLTVVGLHHRGRQLSTELHGLQRERDALNVEWGRLLLEEATWSQHRHVEEVARGELGMAMPGPDRTVLLDLRGRHER